MSIGKIHSAQRQHRHARGGRRRPRAGTPQFFQAKRSQCFAALLENRPQQREIRAVRVRQRNFFGRVTRDADHYLLAGFGGDVAGVAGLKIFRPQMHAVCAQC